MSMFVDAVSAYLDVFQYDVLSHGAYLAVPEYVGDDVVTGVAHVPQLL